MINLNHPIVASMMSRPAKFASDTEMSTVLDGLYGGQTSLARDEAMKLAVQFVVDYKGSFAFVRNLKREAVELGLIPHSKVKGVLNVIRSEALAQRDGRKFSPGKFDNSPNIPVEDTGIDITDLEGNYEHNGLWFHVESPGPASKWYGWRFVSGGMDEGPFRSTNKLSYPKLGSQRPGETLKLKIADPLMRTAVRDWATDVTGSTYKAPTPVATSPGKGKKIVGDYCVRCDHQFPDNATLVAHVNNGHDKPKSAKGFPCTKCPLVFNSAAVLADHMVAYHPSAFTVEAELVVDTNDKPATKKAAGPSIRDRVRDRYHLG